MCGQTMYQHVSSIGSFLEYNCSIASCRQDIHSADPEGEDTAALAGSTVVEEDALSFPTLIPVSLGQLSGLALGMSLLLPWVVFWG